LLNIHLVILGKNTTVLFVSNIYKFMIYSDYKIQFFNTQLPAKIIFDLLYLS